jgi:hypothetical protein
MASIPFNQDFRPGSIKTSDPDQSRLQTKINNNFKPGSIMASIPFNQDFRPGSIKTSDPDQSRLQTKINHDFKPIQLWLQSLSITISFPIN